MPVVKVSKSNGLHETFISLPASKSESNRALIINALCNSPGKIDNLSLARDTEIMQRLLQDDKTIYNAQDAGTVMRFMTAYLSVTSQSVQLTGSAHMKKRPVKILVEALKTIGAKIEYGENSGYPPLLIERIGTQKSETIEIDSIAALVGENLPD